MERRNSCLQIATGGAKYWYKLAKLTPSTTCCELDTLKPVNVQILLAEETTCAHEKKQKQVSITWALPYFFSLGAGCSHCGLMTCRGKARVFESQLSRPS